MDRMKDKVCVITGGVRGLGLAAAEALLAEGAKVMLTDLDREAGEAEIAQLRRAGHEVDFMVQDVTKEERWDEVFQQTVERWGTVDVLVNNAGIALMGDVESVTAKEWAATLAVNLTGVMLGTQHAIPFMKKRGGSIVNVASIEGLIGEAKIPAYNASKGGVRLFTKSAAVHCARKGYDIRINNLCPGFAETQMVSGAVGTLEPEDAKEFVEATLRRIPMGRFAKPSEIAKAVLFLASDESSYMTGSDLVVDGGMTA
jgi:NAD(P)-dependent dehydrogenase (short-subunit alcohol dehydrogenase family)